MGTPPSRVAGRGAGPSRSGTRLSSRDRAIRRCGRSGRGSRPKRRSLARISGSGRGSRAGQRQSRRDPAFAKDERPVRSEPSSRGREEGPTDEDRDDGAEKAERHAGLLRHQDGGETGEDQEGQDEAEKPRARTVDRDDGAAHTPSPASSTSSPPAGVVWGERSGGKLLSERGRDCNVGACMQGAGLPLCRASSCGA